MVQFEAFIQYSTHWREHSSMHPHSSEWWKVDQLEFHHSFLKGCSCGCWSPIEMGNCIQKLSLFKEIQLLLVTLRSRFVYDLFCIQPVCSSNVNWLHPLNQLLVSLTSPCTNGSGVQFSLLAIIMCKWFLPIHVRSRRFSLLSDAKIILNFLSLNVFPQIWLHS